MRTAELTDGMRLGGDPRLAAERALIAACQSGDWSGYGQLVERYRRLVWAAVDAVLDDPSQVEDVVQEVFVRVYEKLHLFGFRSSFSSWLWKLARNHALHQRRKIQRRPWFSLQAKAAGEGPQWQPAGAGSPQADYINAARENVVGTMLRELPEEYRSVLNLYYLGDKTYEDIAALTGLPLNTVRTRLRRAKQRLAEAAQKCGWDFEERQ
jgi:RNA polymerase sigma-70 factor (ECF subfamily)